MLLIVLALCSFAVATTEFVVVGLLPDVASATGVSLPVAGQLVTVYMLVVAVGGPATVVASRRLPRRGVLIASMAAAVAGSLLAAAAPGFGVLLAGRVVSAASQALFMAVASEVALASAAPGRGPAAVARVFSGFALATVAGLPLGSFVGQAFGWRATFVGTAALAALGLLGLLGPVLRRPPTAGSMPTAPTAPTVPTVPTGLTGLTVLTAPPQRLVLTVTLLAFTGFVAAFTYVVPVLRTVGGLSAAWSSAILVVYGAGTLAGNALAGRPSAPSVPRVLPLPLAGLGLLLVAQTPLMGTGPTAAAAVLGLGVTAFTVAPLLQTLLMTLAGPSAAALAAAANLSAFGVAGALGSGLGGAVVAAPGGLSWLGAVAAVPVLVAAGLSLRLTRVVTRSGR